ncbi:MAG: hypothetical protein ACSLE6_12195 [Mycobacterium sp.]
MTTSDSVHRIMLKARALADVQEKHAGIVRRHASADPEVTDLQVRQTADEWTQAEKALRSEIEAVLAEATSEKVSA